MNIRDLWKKKVTLITASVIVLILIPLIWKGAELLQNSGDTLERGQGARIENPVFPYELNRPSQRFELPHCLDEISGLSYLPHNRLACIQDEKGKMYIFDIDRGDVTEKITFGDGNDYEDIEIIENIAYILQSNGTILTVNDFETPDPEVRSFNTLLSSKNNAEGLAFDDEANALLIACKDSPHLKKKKKREELKGKRVIYRFDLAEEKLSKTPAFIIDMEALQDSMRYSLVGRSIRRLIALLDPREEDIDFRPSGIAVHPKTRDVYIISSADRMLIVFNREGHIIAAEQLNRKIFKQPEGICFNPAGDLFISNERRGGRATIVRCDYQG
ncbi:MAG: SdiA-regulated domain-containing protein [bacterium]